MVIGLVVGKRLFLTNERIPVLPLSAGAGTLTLKVPPNERWLLRWMGLRS